MEGQCFVFAVIDIHSGTDLPFLHTMLLPTLVLQMALPTVMVLYIALPKIKKFTTLEIKFGSRPRLMEFSSFNLFSIILRQWNGQNYGMPLGKLNDSGS